MCKEDYTVAEQVRQLPCNHFFHSNCIVPWLELVRAASTHGSSEPNGGNLGAKQPPQSRFLEPPSPFFLQHDTCPVCRKSLNGEDSTRQAQNPEASASNSFSSESQLHDRWTF